MDKDKDKLKDDFAVCRAKITPVDENAEYDFECLAMPSDNGQLRYSYQNDEYFYQVLKTGKENLKVERMESGLPLFDNHPYDLSAINTLGITVWYEFTAEGVVMRTKLGARADDAMRADIKNKILKTVSIEGDVINYSVVRKDGMIPIYYADLWEPTHLNLAPVPQDISSQIGVKRALEYNTKITTPKADKSIIKSLTSKF